ncbi:MAG: hypothetical protein V7709_02770 [Halioglobus sp.]
MNAEGLAKEWSVLQTQCDSYEKYSLLIKLLSIGLVAVAYFQGMLSLFLSVLLLILWFQDAIWKTFQSRTESRILHLEGLLAMNPPDESEEGRAYQFNSFYAKNRPNTIGLIKEYLRHALRPTVAFPYLVLLLMVLAWLFRWVFI